MGRSRRTDGAVLVTGGTSGIGLAVCRALVAAGRPVLAIGRDAQRCAAGNRVLTSAGNALAVQADTTDPDELGGAVELIYRRWGRVVGLGHGGGAAGPRLVDRSRGE